MTENVKNSSYSMILEKKYDMYQEPLSNIMPRKVYNWTDNNTVFNCQNTKCDKGFGIMVRKHHCRLCGKIFCADCTNYMIKIPNELQSEDSKKGTWNEYVSSYIFQKDPLKQKVCQVCFDLVTFIERIKKYYEVFRILGLDIEDLKNVGLVCKEWNNASNYLLSIFREIQYKLPNSNYTDIEKEMLWNNIDYLPGHSRYLVHLIKICKTDKDYSDAKSVIFSNKIVKCWSMMCSRNCREKLSSFDAINLLCHSFKEIGHNDTLRTLALEYLVCDDKELKCYLPLLIYYLKYDNGIISNFIIKKCVNNFELMNALYWELQLYSQSATKTTAYNNLLTKLKQMFNDKPHSESFVKILQCYSFVNLISTISKKIYDERKSYDEIKTQFKMDKTFTCPLNVNYTITDINIDKIKIKESASKPMIIPCSGPKGTIDILYKKEDVRKDQIIINAINIANFILKKEEGLNLDIMTYNVLPTSQQTGMIEIIQNSETIYYIQEKLKSTILNYILDNNDSCTIKDVRERFLNSTAAYCVINYLFGIGDRHLDNIMVNKNGTLFHIDYGYILGNDPILNNPGIRITNEIIDAIGGQNSKNYQIFTELCTRIFNCLRRNIDIFINMFVILPHISDIKMTEEDIKNVLIKRFIPGETQLNADLHIVNQLEKQNYLDKIKDWCHYHSKEKTVSSTVNKVAYAMANIVMSNMEDKAK